MSIVVYHASYGCDTGCCGHVIDDGLSELFVFEHPDGMDYRQWVEQWLREGLGPEHVADLDWDNCLITDH